MQIILVLISVICWSVPLFAQSDQHKHIALKINAQFNGKPFELAKKYQLNGAEVELEALKFYLGHFCLLHKGKVVWQEDKRYVLVDFSIPPTLEYTLTIPSGLKYDQLQCLLGVDSLTHEAGVMGGDLDPTKGMYWTWNTGYIQFKIEGQSTLSKARDHRFQYHLGGYAAPYQSVQTLGFHIKKTKNLVLTFDVSAFLAQADIASEYKVMSPGEKAKKLSQIASTCFILFEHE